MSPLKRHRAGVALSVASLAALAGCGGGSSTKTIDPSRVEKAIEVSVAEQSHRISIVVCPTGIKRQTGKTFICIATLAHGEKYPFKVTERDDKGNVHYEQAAGGSSSGTTTTGS